MKIYIAGAITENKNYKSDFASAEKYFTKKGYTVLNPVKNLGFEYKEYIDMGLNELMRCDVIYFLKGWEKSKGATLEFHYAQTTNMIMWFEP